MALGAVVGVATQLLPTGFQTSAQRDVERFARADALAASARAGDTAARTELERLSREFATQPAKDYAKRKLAELGSPVSNTSSGNAATLLSSPAQALRQPGSLPLWVLLILAGGVGFAVYKIAKKG